jgi:metal-sulfur cluster biosynthetic enzyme
MRFSGARMQSDLDQLRDTVIDRLKAVYAPAVPINVFDLGLVYGVQVDGSGRVDVRITVTAPGYPVTPALVEHVRHELSTVPGVREANVEPVWDPPWTRERMSKAARFERG